MWMGFLLFCDKITTMNSTNDAIIRHALREKLTALHSNDPRLRIIDEMGIKHGAARIDMAVINGVLHGYEIKSDRDTLLRLPEQMNVYNSVFDQVTLVVGKSHLFDAINIVPDWWGIEIAKIDHNDVVIFSCIRKAQDNPMQDSISIARLLWREEALEILESRGEATGLRSKPRRLIYEKLACVLDKNTLSEKVRGVLFSRPDWRLDAPLVPSGG